MLRRFAIAFVVLLAACDVRPPVTTRVTLEFIDEDRVRISAAAPNDDELASRFAIADPESERIVIDKKRGAITGVAHSGTIERLALQRFFTDIPMTIKFERGDGWSELGIYPGTSTRATRPQRDHVASMLHLWSQDGARYIDTMSKLYAYIDANPQRAGAVFRLLLDDTEQLDAIAEERALINAAIEAMNQVRQRIEGSRANAPAIAAEFDLVYNPLPHDITVRVPHEIVSFENFEKRSDEVVTIRRASVFDAVAALGDKWISPDPLAMMIRGEKFDAGELATRPRRAAPFVTPAEIEKALIERLAPANAYRVKWPE